MDTGAADFDCRYRGSVYYDGHDISGLFAYLHIGCMGGWNRVHLFDLLHQRIPGIGAGALVVEGLLHHFVQTAQEGLFGNTVMLIRQPDAKIIHTESPRSRI